MKLLFAVINRRKEIIAKIKLRPIIFLLDKKLSPTYPQKKNEQIKIKIAIEL